jgi:O-antigen ligase
MIGLGILLLGIYITMRLFIGEQNRERWDFGQMIRDIALRFDMVWQLLEAWLESPAHWLFGLGTNAYSSIGASVHSDYVHNIAVEVLCEHGLVGGATFGLLLIFTVRAGVQAWRIHRYDPQMRAVVATLMAICAFSMFLGLKQGSITFPAPFYWWMVLAKLSSFERRQYLPAEEADQEPDSLIDPELSVAYAGSPDEPEAGSSHNVVPAY